MGLCVTWSPSVRHELSLIGLIHQGNSHLGACFLSKNCIGSVLPG